MFICIQPPRRLFVITKISTDFDPSYTFAELSLSAKLKNTNPKNTNRYFVEISLFEEGSTDKTNPVFTENTNFIDFTSSSLAEFHFKRSNIINPAKWFAETPNLYTLTLKLKDSNGNLIEYLSSR